MPGKLKNNFPIILFAFWVVIFIALVTYKNTPEKTLSKEFPGGFNKNPKQTFATTEPNTPKAKIKKAIPAEKKIAKIEKKPKTNIPKKKEKKAAKEPSTSQKSTSQGPTASQMQSAKNNRHFALKHNTKKVHKEKKWRKPQLKHVEIDGPNKVLHSDQQYQFEAYGYDQNRKRISFEEQWESNGGEITDQGLFTAGTVPGRFFIMVRDIETYRRARIYITIAEQITDIKIEGPSRALKTRERFHFKANVYNQSGELTVKRIKWYAKGGIIDRNGYFTAGNIPGIFTISVRIMGTRMRAQLNITIEYRILPCTICHRSGRLKSTCDSCNGKGWRKDKNGKAQDCSYCQNGYTFHRCHNCNGSGNIRK